MMIKIGVMNCPECNAPMVRRKSKFRNKFWWGCSNYPQCKVTSAEHPDGSLLSTPASQEIKDLRNNAHRIAAIIWGKWDSPKCKKREMYDWLKNNTKSGHIGHMDKDELILTITRLEEMVQKSS